MAPWEVSRTTTGAGLVAMGYSRKAGPQSADSQTGAPVRISLLLLGPADRLDDNVIHGDIFVDVAGAGLHFSDFIHDAHTINHLPEDAVTDLIRGLGPVKEGVVLDIDEELGSRAIGSSRSGHGNGAALVRQTV